MSSEGRPPALGPTDRGLLASIACAIALLTLPLMVPLLTGRVFAHGDLGCYHVPVRALYADALSAGDSVLWSSAIFGGYYLHGEGQVGMFHPWHLFLYGFLPLHVAFNVELIASYAVALVGMAAFLRRLGVGVPGSLLGAITFAFSGFNLLRLLHPNAIAIVAHIPWLLLGVEHLVTGESSRMRAWAGAGVAVLVGSQILLGYPQYLVLSSVIVGAYTLLRAFQLGAASGLGGVAAFGLLGLAMGAAQILPTAEMAADSSRAALPASFTMSFSLHPINLVQIWSPYAFPGRVYATTLDEFQVHELGIYNGTFSAVALLWILARWRALTHRRLAGAAFGLLVVGVVLALGRYGGVYPLIAQLPPFDQFRAPARFILLVHVGMAVLTALALDDLFGVARRRERLAPAVRLALGAAVVLSVIGSLAALPFLHDAPSLSSQPTALRVVTGVALVAAAARFFVLVSRGARPALLILPIFVAFDLGSWGLGYAFPDPPRTVAELAASVDVPDTIPPGSRIAAPSLTAACNAALLRGYGIIPAYVGLPPARVLPRADEAALRLAGVSWRQIDGAWTPLDAMPRVRLVGDVRQSGDIPRDIDAIDIATTALVGDALPGIEGRAGSATVVEDRPGKIVVDVNASHRSLLVTTETYHTGWQATSESGQVVSMVRTYGDYLGAVVEPGVGQVEMVFEPTSARIGLLISGVAVILTALLTLWLYRP